MDVQLRSRSSVRTESASALLVSPRGRHRHGEENESAAQAPAFHVAESLSRRIPSDAT